MNLSKTSPQHHQIPTPHYRTRQIDRFVHNFDNVIENILRGLLGLTSLLTICWLMSYNRKAINWPTVLKALALQVLLALCILKIPGAEQAFDFMSRAFVKVVSFSQNGANFLFAALGTGKIESPLVNFVIMVLPTIIFFSALSSMLYYRGILQRVVYIMAWCMKKVLRLSGSESLSTAANIFLGQTEAPLLVKPYLAGMTRSEIFCVMVGGMATIAGGVLAAYIGFLGGNDPAQQAFFARHLMTASVMCAPATILTAKMILPETETYHDTMGISKESMGENVLEAIANGTTDGLKLAVNVASMLLVFIGLMALVNYLVSWLGTIGGINEMIRQSTSYDGLSLQFILGYALSPLMWLMGVCAEDAPLLGQLLGEKTVLNEFVAYVSLGGMKNKALFTEQKSIIMATYILCGFSNFASIGIQIGGIGNLAPNIKPVMAKIAVKAMIAGTLACMFTSVIVGMMY